MSAARANGGGGNWTLKVSGDAFPYFIPFELVMDYFTVGNASSFLF